MSHNGAGRRDTFAVRRGGISAMSVWRRRAATFTTLFLLVALLAIPRAVAAMSPEQVSALILQAGNDDPEAQYRLGRLYLEGRHLPTDGRRARRLFEQSANLGYAPAQRTLGDWIYHNYDFTYAAEALGWYEKAAAQGDARALHMAGRMRFFGEGCEPDRRAGLRYLRQAAGKNDSGALLDLGILYRDGRGTKRDAKRAAQYLERAAALDNDDARVALAAMYFRGEGVPRDVGRAVRHTEEAAKRNRQAAHNLAVLRREGIGGPRDAASAMETLAELTRVHSFVNAYSCYELAKMYREGIGVDADPEKAARLMERAAERGRLTAAGNLFDTHGEAGAKKLAPYLEKARAGDTEAQIQAGLRCLWGVDTDRDTAQALYWFEQAAGTGAGSARAHTMLGLMHALGFAPVPGGRPEAVRRFARAAEMGDVNGRCALGYLLFSDNRLRQGGKQEGLDLLLLAAAQDYLPALLTLSHIYRYDADFMDEEKALAAALRSAELGHGRMLWAVADARFAGMAEEYRPDDALDLLERGAAYGDALCLETLAQRLAEAGGGAESPRGMRARGYLERLEQRADGYRLYRLGLRYLEGGIVPRDEERAPALFARAMTANDPEVALSLGRLYLHGKPPEREEGTLVERDAEKAYAYFERAGIYGPAMISSDTAALFDVLVELTRHISGGEIAPKRWAFSLY